jgi:hypothetical protein
LKTCDFYGFLDFFRGFFMTLLDFSQDFIHFPFQLTKRSTHMKLLAMTARPRPTEPQVVIWGSPSLDQIHTVMALVTRIELYHLP